MTERNDGGPAFPLAATYHSAPQRGMTLRDWFAGQALAGIVASAEYEKSDWAEVYAKEAYTVADAMLRARKETT